MEIIGHFFQTALPYLLQGLLGLIALIAVAKDWKDYGEATGKYANPVRIAVLIFTVAVIFLSFVDTYNSRSEATRKETESKKQIDDLTEQVRLERDENKHNADGFRQSFDALYKKYSDLATRTHDADLLREIKQTRDELKVTRDRLDQPKAQLTAGFWEPNNHTDIFPLKTTVQRRPDGSVAFDINTLNSSDVNALSGGLVVRICRTCKFAKEPQGSINTPGASEQDREFHFQHVFAHSKLPKFTVEVIPPSGSGFEVDVFYRCENCSSDKQTLFVYVQ
jgi:Tfp pilus assembly protein PilV